MMEGVVYLQAEIIRDGAALRTVKLATPTVADMRGMALCDIDMGDVDAIATLLPRITRPALSRDEVARLTIADVQSARQQLQRLKLPPPPPML